MTWWFADLARRGTVVALAAALAGGPAAAPAREPAPGAAPPASAAPRGLRADEVAAILAHGPWPPAPFRDASNRLTDQPAAIELGRRLFFDARLSGDGRMACATCHRPALGFADGLPRSLDRDGRPLERNAPGLLDVGGQRWFGWDGAADSLWSFVLRPLGDPREMAADDGRLAALLGADPDLAPLARRAFGAAPGTGQQLRVDVAKAIAAWLQTLVSPRTRFDAFRDALAAGDAAGVAAYPADALRGLRLFVGEGRCTACHTGPAFTHGEFHDIGRPHMAPGGVPDPGRHRGAAAVLASPYNRLGRFSDATDPTDAVHVRHLAPAHRNFGEFRVPGLRGALATAPYGHDGSMPTLADVIDHYSRLDPERLHADGEALLRPLRLDPGPAADLLAFLRSLSEPALAP
jgi:cytochrome c peroxidase